MENEPQTERDLFNKSHFVLKISGYKFHSRHIYEDICEALAPLTGKRDVALNEDLLRSFRKEHEEYSSKKNETARFFERHPHPTAVIPHETGLEVFLLSFASGATGAALYSFVKTIVDRFIDSLEEQNRRFPTEHDSEDSYILAITRRYALRLGVVHKISPVQFRLEYSDTDDELIKSIDAVIRPKAGRALSARMKKILYPEVRILFLASSPIDTDRIRADEEARSIDQILRQSDLGYKFDLEQQWAVRIVDIQGHFLRYRPDIVHFSGHGSQESQIVLEDFSGSSHPVPTHALSQLFRILKDNVRCVVLSACFSELQAQAIAEHVDAVIGMTAAIQDRAALAFSVAFYQALAFGRDVKTAFDLGCLQIDLQSLTDHDIPKLLAIKSDPAKLAFVRDADSFI